MLSGAALLVLAVKPQDAAAALRAARAHWPGPSTALLSIVAGLRIEALARLCPPETPIVRAMPNRPALLSAGVTGLYAPPSVPAPVRALAETLAAATGHGVWVRNEDELDVVTAVSGSGPAYFLLLAEQLASAAQACGLSHETARLLATETLYGSGVLAHSRARDEGGLREERAAVTSPGGTTEAALRVLAGRRAGAARRACRAGRDRTQPRAGRRFCRQRRGKLIDSQSSHRCKRAKFQHYQQHAITHRRTNHAMAALIYIIETLLTLCLVAVLLRLLLQWSRADFRNPLARSIVHLTNPVIVPLRRLLPAIGRLDTASCVALIVAALLQVSASWLLSGLGPPPGLLWLRLALVEILRITLWTYFLAIVLYAMLSLIAPGTYSPAQGLLVSLCEPVLRAVSQTDSAARQSRSIAAVGRDRDSGAADSAALKRAARRMRHRVRNRALHAHAAPEPIKKGILRTSRASKSICVGTAVCYVARRFAESALCTS